MKHVSDFIKQSSLIFIAVGIFNFLNLLYQIYMARNLSPVNYGTLNSLFSILMVISIPSGTLQTVITKYVSNYYAFNQYEKINLLLHSFIKKTFIFGAVVFLAISLFSKYISHFLQIESPILIIMLGMITFFSIILPLTQGVLQGMQKFGCVGFAMIANGSLKLLLGILFITIGFEINGAMSALVISTFITLLISFIMLFLILPKPLDWIAGSSQISQDNPDISLPKIFGYSYAVITVFLCYMILTNVDVLLVKHFFKPLDAGYYSIAQMIGKIILFLPVAITLVMFPKTSELHTQAKNTLNLLTKSLVYVGILCGMAALICLLFPGLILKILSGQEHSDCIPLARIFSITMFFFALLYVLLFYHLSIHYTGFIYSLLLLTILQIVMIVLFHQRLSQVLYIMCCNAVLLFLINLYLAFKWKNSYVADGISCNS